MVVNCNSLLWGQKRARTDLLKCIFFRFFATNTHQITHILVMFKSYNKAISKQVVLQMSIIIKHYPQLAIKSFTHVAQNNKPNDKIKKCLPIKKLISVYLSYKNMLWQDFGKHHHKAKLRCCFCHTFTTVKSPQKGSTFNSHTLILQGSVCREGGCYERLCQQCLLPSPILCITPLALQTMRKSPLWPAAITVHESNRDQSTTGGK